MSRSTVIAVVCLSAGAALGQPVVENLYVPTPTFATIVGPITQYTNIPETEKTVTVPAGDFSINWRAFPIQDGGVLQFRPVVGDVFPAEGLTSGSGSWSSHTDGGTITVKLQAIEFSGAASLGTQSKSSVSWTLTVFPDAETVPAIGEVGLVLLAIALVVAGSLVFRRPMASA